MLRQKGVMLLDNATIQLVPFVRTHFNFSRSKTQRGRHTRLAGPGTARAALYTGGYRTLPLSLLLLLPSKTFCLQNRFFSQVAARLVFK